jgi:RHS repeat-associated protein
VFDAVSQRKTVMLPSAQRLTYTYDAIGQRSALTAPTGGRFTYAYDAAQRITRVVNPEGDRTSYSYDANSRRTVKKLANGTRASFTYDNADQLTTVANMTSAGAYVSRYDYKYDGTGNRMGVLEANGDRVTWVYDATYQLTAERRSGASAYANTFTYDSRSNRTVKNESGTRTTTVYDGANQIRYSQALAGRTTYTFDASGNQQVELVPAGTRTTTTWNYENQPTKYNQPANVTYPVVTMTYNADNQRVKKESPVGTTKFIWDDQNYLAEADASDVIQTVYTNEPQYYGNLISTRLATTSNYHHFDALGSTRQVSTAAEAVSDTLIYDAWGNVIARTGSTAIRMLWIGQVGYYWDPETGLFWVQIRPIGPIAARWLTEDSAEYVDGPNRYIYVRNKPLSEIDPSGMKHGSPSPSKPQPPPPGPTCSVLLECVHLGLPFGPRHCGLTITDSKGSTSINIGGGIGSGAQCNILYEQVFFPPWSASYSSYSPQASWRVAESVCQCIRDTAKLIDSQHLPYSPIPVNSDCGGAAQCNSNYTTKCLLSNCGLYRNQYLVGFLLGFAPVGWNHRMEKCSSVGIVTSHCGSCVCYKWETVDDAWCSPPPGTTPTPPTHVF